MQLFILYNRLARQSLIRYVPYPKFTPYLLLRWPELPSFAAGPEALARGGALQPRQAAAAGELYALSLRAPLLPGVPGVLVQGPGVEEGEGQVWGHQRLDAVPRLSHHQGHRRGRTLCGLWHHEQSSHLYHPNRLCCCHHYHPWSQSNTWLALRPCCRTGGSVNLYVPGGHLSMVCPRHKQAWWISIFTISGHNFSICCKLCIVFARFGGTYH